MTDEERFFYELGSRLGEERLYRYASLYGLTSKTGIDLPNQANRANRAVN